MAGTDTVTGKVGPGVTVTALVIQNVKRSTIDMNTNMLYVTTSDSPQVQEYGITSATTITATKSGSTYTLTIS